MFGWEWKSGGMEKVSLYKFTHIPLLKNDGQLKQKKSNKQSHTHTHTQKKKKGDVPTHHPRNQKKKKFKKN